MEQFFSGLRAHLAGDSGGEDTFQLVYTAWCDWQKHRCVEWDEHFVLQNVHHTVKKLFVFVMPNPIVVSFVGPWCILLHVWYP
jgi:hypothetical protein